MNEDLAVDIEKKLIVEISLFHYGHDLFCSGVSKFSWSIDNYEKDQDV